MISNIFFFGFGPCFLVFSLVMGAKMGATRAILIFLDSQRQEDIMYLNYLGVETSTLGGKGFLMASTKESKDRLEKIAKKAIRKGFIHLDHLIWVMAENEIYTDCLLRLWKNSPCPLRLSEEPKVTTEEDRTGTWFHLFQWWTGNLVAAVRVGSNGDPPELTLYSFDPKTSEFRKHDPERKDIPPYINLEEFQGFLEDHDLLLPKRLFPSVARTMPNDIKPHKNDPQAFPELRLEHLKRYAKRWGKKFSNVPIKRIILYRYSPYLPEYFKGIPVKYAVVFEIPDINHSDYEDYLSDRFAKREFGKDEDPKWEGYGKLVAATEYRHTMRQSYPFSALIDAGFSDAHKRLPSGDFRDEWTFIPDSKAPGLHLRIKLDEPYWVLYDSRDALQITKEKAIPENKLDVQETPATLPEVSPYPRETFLETWKEIAKYLGCSVITAKRLRKELTEAKVIFYGHKGRPPRKVVRAWPSDIKSWTKNRSKKS